MSSMFLLVYYTDVVGISAAAVGHVVPGRPVLGCLRRRLRRSPGGQDLDALGKVPSLPALRLGSLAAAQRGHLFRAGRLSRAATRLRLRLLRALRPGLQPREHPLRLLGDGDDPATRRTRQALHLPHRRLEPHDPAVGGRRLAADRGLRRPAAIADHHDAGLSRGRVPLYLFTSSPRERVERDRSKVSLRQTVDTIGRTGRCSCCASRAWCSSRAGIRCRRSAIFYARDVLGNANYYIVMTVVQTAGTSSPPLFVPRLVRTHRQEARLSGLRRGGHRRRASAWPWPQRRRRLSRLSSSSCSASAWAA